MTRPDVLPSAKCTASPPRIGIFRGSMAGLCAPLSTLRRIPRGQLRMTRVRCGSLLLHRKRLALSTPCRSPGASQMSSALPPRTDIDLARRFGSNGFADPLLSNIDPSPIRSHDRNRLYERDITAVATPAAFGVALADPSRRTILITGEGSSFALARSAAFARSI